MTTFDIWLNVSIPIVVVIAAANADEAKKKALEMYNDGKLNDSVQQSFRENNETVHVFNVVKLWEVKHEAGKHV